MADISTGLVLEGTAPKAKPVTFRCKKGKVAVAQESRPEKTEGGIYLSDQIRDDLFPDIGTVISSGEDGVDVGDVVVVSPYVGMFVEGLAGYEMVRFLGDESLSGISIPVPIEDHIVAKVIEGRTLTPIKKNVLIALAEVKQKEGSIYLPTSAQSRTGLARVISIGELVEDVKEGEKVRISLDAVQRIDVGEEFHKSYGLVDERLAFIHEDSIFAGY